MDKINVAIIGVGYLGRQHARIYSELESVELVGVVDKNPETAAAVASEFGTTAYADFRKLLGKVTAASLAAPTSEHASIGCELLRQGIDVLVEKPIASSLEGAEALIQTAQAYQRILQVGHLERFNPAVVAARSIARHPLFFEVHRLGVFTSRSLDIDVVFDLMIHDLDVVLDLVRSPVKSVSAVGLPILSHKIDIANARIEFESGCVANLTASRVSTEKVRKLRFFQPSQYVSLDYTRQDVVVLSVKPGAADAPPVIAPRKIETARVEPLKAEIESFLNAVKTRTEPEVTAASSKQALELAQRVVEQIQAHTASLPVSVAEKS
ncbi:MAG: Gfo/Idh/MocA family oxidoreductase [Acidobacteria bacterium]|nr:Gfo/Idh/MocA family oxidoreductase [Acidobacteriota bacterium]MCI0718021.1 Gfo/Idh/MocA family oxidoreductase [Acidobacteriota bacterium]